MKYYSSFLLLILVVAFPLAPMADEAADKKIIVIDGKKFFPLREARHFYGTSNPQPIAINKYIKQPVGTNNSYKGQTTVIKRGEDKQTELVNKKTFNSNKPAIGNSINKTDSALPNTGQNSTASKVLSIFAPEEKPSFQPSEK